MADKKPIILISIDHKWRDLAGYVYAKILLEKLGYCVVFIRNGFEEYYADVLNPRAIVMVHLYDRSKSKLIRRLKQRNIIIILMPTEGIPTLEGTRKLAAGYFSDLSGVDLHFLWNDEMRKLMQEGKVVEPEKLCVIGVPRFDFYMPPLKKSLLKREELANQYGFRGDFPIITWATNFTIASFCEKNMDFLKEDWKKLQIEKLANPEDAARKDYVSRELHFKTVTNLVREVKNINLLCKLHPSEDHTYYYKKLRNANDDLRNRIRIINQEYIWDVLNATDILLKRSCTTGVEAWLLGKPTIELKLNPKDQYYSKEHAAGSNEVKDYGELKNWVEFYLNGGEIPPILLKERKKFIDKWCYRIDGQSTKRFVSKTDEIIQRNTSKTVIKPKIFTKNFAKSLMVVLLMGLTNFKIHNLKVYGLRAKVDKLGRYDKFFDRSDERYWVNRIKEAISSAVV